jgi:hypothetical protein
MAMAIRLPFGLDANVAGIVASALAFGVVHSLHSTTDEGS